MNGKAQEIPAWRKQAWTRLTERSQPGKDPWDMLVIGGGITGAGILREAARRGLAAALIEQRDFAWGTSSRSSNMVHGGLRYLEAGQIKLARASVRERERMLSEASGLVNPLGFLYSDYKGIWPPRRCLAGLLTAYDFLAGRWNHRYYSLHDYLLLAPRIRLTGLKGGTQYGDAITDDARLTFRVIQEAKRDGSLALNYVAADHLIKEKGHVCGVVARDILSDHRVEIRAKAVINATGAWVDKLRHQVEKKRIIRPLRGSHLVFPFWRIPIGQAVALAHPSDGRYTFLLPWEGATVVGNTDLDHEKDLNEEASITPREVDYLLEFVRFQFPCLEIRHDDILSTWSGVRPVIGTGKKDPSKEKREHGIWVEDGLISVSGGKLTTFRLIALDVLRRAAEVIPSLEVQDKGEPVFGQMDEKVLLSSGLDYSACHRIIGRFGTHAKEVISSAKKGELCRIPGTSTLWVEVRWAARHEEILHLEDILFRRTRLGVLLKQGGADYFDRFKDICREELGWDDDRWQNELKAYKTLWQTCHSVP